jgi:hypothetical protein
VAPAQVQGECDHDGKTRAEILVSATSVMVRCRTRFEFHLKDRPRSRQAARSRFQPCGGGLVTRPGLLGHTGPCDLPERKNPGVNAGVFVFNRQIAAFQREHRGLKNR